MSDVAVRAKGLSKMYRIGGPQENYQTFRDTITRTISTPFKRARDLLRGQAYGASGLQEEIWALKDISFEVKHGEVVGIIGRNGAGKSTLLKVLSRITEPSEGYIDVYGRVGALLEVGTGFHQELTGRENIYLNGAILGMKRHEIKRMFDEIVAFAEVSKFIDTPVKHYSSGMRLRLGFAVAAFLEPDILVVDEVLAVGDASFQQKCLGKMNDVAREGRTVLFVSHNMSSIVDLCERAIWLNRGTIEETGSVTSVIQKYLRQVASSGCVDLSIHEGRVGNKAILRELQLLTDGTETSTFRTLEQLTIKVTCQFTESHRSISLGFVLKDQLGSRVFAAHLNQYLDASIPEPGVYVFSVSFEQLSLSPGGYSISLYLGNGSFDFDIINEAAYFDVVWNPSIDLLYPPQAKWGPLFAPLAWNIVNNNGEYVR